MFAKFAAFIRLVLDTIGQMPTIARLFRAYSFQVTVTRRLTRFSRRVGTFRDFFSF